MSVKDCFIFIERRKTSFDFPVHIHPEYELNFIEHAAGAQRIVGDSVETIGDEELVLITNPNLEHAWINHECKSTDIHEITIQFHHTTFPEELLGKNQFESIKRMFERAERGLLFGSASINKVRALLKEINLEPDPFYSVLRLLMVLHELSLSEDVRELATHSFVASGHIAGEDNRIDKIVEYLNKNYNRPVRLEDVAKHVNMSIPVFSRYIKQHTAKSFIEFFIDIRLGIVARLLIDTEQSITEICYSCGFNNVSNFNRLFKKCKGVSPSEFRENYRKKRVIV